MGDSICKISEVVFHINIYQKDLARLFKGNFAVVKDWIF
jgi:hypothetical protein